MADDHRTTRETFKSSFESAQCIDVEVVGWFVEKEQVSAALQQLGKMHAVSFSTGQVAHKFLLVASFEVET